MQAILILVVVVILVGLLFISLPYIIFFGFLAFVIGSIYRGFARKKYDNQNSSGYDYQNEETYSNNSYQSTTNQNDEVIDVEFTETDETNRS